LHAVIFMGLYVLLDVRHFGTHMPLQSAGSRQCRSSVWWRFSWLSSCPERWSDDAPPNPAAGELWRQLKIAVGSPFA